MKSHDNGSSIVSRHRGMLSLLGVVVLGACGGGSASPRPSPIDSGRVVVVAVDRDAAAGLDLPPAQDVADAPIDGKEVVGRDAGGNDDVFRNEDVRRDDDVARNEDLRRNGDVTQLVDLPPDSAWSIPTNEAACLAATNVPQCGALGFSASTLVFAEDGTLPLAKVELKSGACILSKNPLVEGEYKLSGTKSLIVGDVCELLVTLADGGQRMVQVQVVERSLSPRCCGYPLPPYPGQWVALREKAFSPNPVRIGAPVDGGVLAPDADASLSGPADAAPDGGNRS